MRATTTSPLPVRLLGVASAATLALTMVPGSASAASTDAQVPVRVKVADQPAVTVPVEPRTWPSSLVESLGVDVDGNDIVKVVRDGRVVDGDAKRVRSGDTVRLVDVVKERKTKETAVAPDVVEVPTTDLDPGDRKVVQKGKPGVRRLFVVRTLHNGEPVDYRVVGKKMLREPRDRRVLVGREPYSVPGADGLNWGALAQCESGGNPRAVNPAGYYGLYQFDVGTWRSVGGSGLPTQASAAEQTYRAKLLYKARGRSPWPNCGRLL